MQSSSELQLSNGQSCPSIEMQTPEQVSLFCVSIPSQTSSSVMQSKSDLQVELEHSLTTTRLSSPSSSISSKRQEPEQGVKTLPPPTQVSNPVLQSSSKVHDESVQEPLTSISSNGKQTPEQDGESAETKQNSESALQSLSELHAPIAQPVT
jgi:hypothetical protein